MHDRSWGSLVVVVLSVLMGCGSQGSGQGEVGGHCYPNGTCNVGLSCIGGICVAAAPDAQVGTRDSNDSDAPVVDSAVADGPSADAAIDAPVSVDAVIDAMPSGPCVPRQVPANTTHIHSAGATSHAGENCLLSGCHLATNVGTGAPGFEFAGTLYGQDGVTPNTGATVSITSVGGSTRLITTDTVGNFYLNAGQLSQPFPATTTVTVCATGSTTGPAPTAMVGPLQSSDGACSRSGCHAVGSAQGVIKLDPTM